MAERTSTRSASRRTTPQPALGPSRRTLRSQSRDVSENEIARDRPKARRGPKTGSSEPEPSARGQINETERNRRAANHSSRALQDLTTVQEDPSVIYPGLEQGDHSSPADASEDENTSQQLPIQTKSPGGVSAFSGTTARTSRTAQEFSDLSSEEMVDSLEDLSEDSDKILKLLVSQVTSEASVRSLMSQLQTRASLQRRNLDRLAARFLISRDRYSSESFISQDEVLRILFGTRGISNKGSSWQPHALLQKANLAILASGMLSRSGQSQDSQFMDDLDRSFPTPFLKGFKFSGPLQTGYSELKNETLQLAIELRMQHAVLLLARHLKQPNFDSDVILQQVFYKDAKSLRGWGIAGLHAEDLTSEVQGAIISQLEKIREIFMKSEDPSSSIRLLQKEFPWYALVLRTIEWTRQRSIELDSQITVSGGATGIHAALMDEVQITRIASPSIKDEDINHDAGPQIILDYEIPSEVSHMPSEPQEKPNHNDRVKVLQLKHFNSNSPKARNAMAKMKQIEAAMIVEANREATMTAEQLFRQEDQQSDADIQVTATAGPSTGAMSLQGNSDDSIVPSSNLARVSAQNDPEPQQEDSWRAQDADEDDVHLIAEPPKPTSPQLRAAGRQVVDIEARQQAESNKENIEVQRSQTELQPQRNPKPSLLDHQPNATRVRFYSQGSDEELQPGQAEQMEDVSTDEGFQTQQPVPAKIARRHESKPVSKRPASQPSISQGPSPKKARNHEVGLSSRPEVSPGRLDGESLPSQELLQYRDANIAAKQTKNFLTKAPQTRRPWSEEETDTLLALMKAHGTSWTLLLKMDASKILQERGQVALKDKARNIKVDFLKASRRKVPKYLKDVSISSVQIDKLSGQGIDYDTVTGQRVDAIGSSDDE